MALGQLLSSPDQVVLQVASSDAEGVIRELTGHLVQSGRLSEKSRKEVEKAVLGREKSMSTGVGNGVAIPHAITPKVTRVLAILGTSSDGIDFKASDGGLVHLVIMLVVPDGEFRGHLGNLSQVARSMSREEFRRQITEATSPEEVIELIRKADEP